MSEKTVMYEHRAGTPHLTIITGGQARTYTLAGEQELGRPTRAHVPALPVPSGVASRRHGVFVTGPDGVRYADAGSLNGTVVAAGTVLVDTVAAGTVLAAIDSGEGDSGGSNSSEGDPRGANPGRLDPAGSNSGERDPRGANPGRLDPAGSNSGERDPRGANPGRLDPAGTESSEGDPRRNAPTPQMLPAGVEYLLSDGDILRIHGEEDPNSEMDVVMIYSTAATENRTWRRIPLTDAAEVAIGRGRDLHLTEKSVSRRHASLFRAKKGWALLDLGSLNGVYLNAARLEEPAYLHKYDVIRIADYYFVFLGDELLCLVDEGVEMPDFANAAAAEGQSARANAESLEISETPESPETSESPKPTPPSTHAQSATIPESVAARTVPDVTQKQWPQEPSPPSHKNSDEKNRPRCHTQEPGLSIWIEERNVWQRARKKTLLRDIRVDIPAGSLVLILGGSGAGKTTFMNAVMGYERAEGEILYKGTDIYREYEQMKYEIGYVPQEDLLRLNDSVWDTLLNAANMRLPIMSPAEYAERVEETLHLLGLERLRDSLVGKLSGGQRKRLSIAVEYIGNPALFFLDEPDSGLDGTMARQLWDNLRTIADQGKIVMVISHSPDRAFQMFDDIIVLAKGSDEVGRLVFFGPPAQACTFFDVTSLEEIMQRINYPEEGGEGLADMYICRFEEGDF